MNNLVYLIFPALIALLFTKARLYKINDYNPDYMGIMQSKALLGFFALLIILHHISQKTGAQLATADFSRFALQPFTKAGYLFVAYFFFCSGFGLYKSFASKENYLDGFLKKHLLPVIIVFFLTDALFLYARASREIPGFPANTYSWFVFALIALYIAFYFCFRFFKNKALLGLSVFALLWCIIARLVQAQSYWYNSLPAFALGALFAKNQAGLDEKIKRKYPLFVILGLLLFALIHFFAVEDMIFYKMTGAKFSYTAIREIQNVLQIFAALIFCLLITCLGMKIKIGNKALSFLGGMTLELYLIHVLFVELFCQKFLGRVEPLFYIKNPFLYILAVTGLTLPLAWLVSLVRSKVLPLIINMPWVNWAGKILRKALLVLLVIAVIVIAYSSVTSHITSSKEKENVEQYKKDFITLTQVDGKSMASYVTGQGEKTVLLLGDFQDPVPSMTLSPLAQRLSHKYKVIVPDYFGSGFSDNTDKQRSSQNIAAELNELITKLGCNKVIVFAFSSSGLIAQTFIKNYPAKVEGLFGLNMLTPQVIKESYDNPVYTDEQIFYNVECSEKQRRFVNKFLSITGLVRMEVAMYREVFNNGALGKSFDSFAEVYISKNSNKESIMSIANMFVDARAMIDYKLPADLPFDLEEPQNSYIIYYNPASVVQMFESFTE